MRLARVSIPASLVLSLAIALSLAARQVSSFRSQQLEYPRVKTAAKETDDSVHALLAKQNLQYPPRHILFRSFKQDGLLEVWAANAESEPHRLLLSIPVCASSGTLGPKRRYGDSQVPEGFYEIDQFNPQSAFFLSLHVSYPNASDRIRGSSGNLGGDIFVHGGCATIGCLPLTDSGIKQVYWLAVLARQSGQRHIPIWIFPARLTDSGYRQLALAHRGDTSLVAFWGNLKLGYDQFEKSRLPLKYSVSPDGAYVFQP